MKRLIYLGVTLTIAAASVFTGLSASGAGAKSMTIMEFSTMAGVPRPYTGTTNAIRGIPGGGLPWVINTATGELKQSGDLEVKVTGLVLDPNDPAVIAGGNAGKNPIANFKASVSCQTVDASGSAAVVNVSTGLFPATMGLASAGGGNAKIEAHLELPMPCLAPIIFVTSPGGAWFAATGF